MGLFGGDSGGDGGFDSSRWRENYSKLNKKYEQLYKERQPVLENYEKESLTQLHNLIGKTAPEAARSFADANKLTSAAQKNLADAQGYDTAERREAERGKAMSDVAQAGDASRAAAVDRLESFGIDPSQTRSASLDAGLRLNTALQQVKAATDAETGVEERGHQYVNDALGVNTSALNSATASRGNATNMLRGNVDAVNSTANMYGDIFGTPMSNLAAQTNINSLSLQAKAAESASRQPAAGGGGGGMSGLMGLAGMAAGAYLGSAGGPLGAQAGAQTGGALGSAAGGQLQ